MTVISEFILIFRNLMRRFIKGGTLRPFSLRVYAQDIEVFSNT